MSAFEITLLFDTYGGMLTEKQQEYLDMRYNQDLSLGEIGEMLGVSRQAVCDNLTRTEALLRKMEQNIGCVSRNLQTRRAVETILNAAESLRQYPDGTVSDLAERIISAAQSLEE